MDNLVYKKRKKVTIGVLVFFIGICLVMSTYFKQKKLEIYDEMNEIFYEELVNLEIMTEELLQEEIEAIIESGNDETIPELDSPVVPITKPVIPAIDYTKYYVGYLSIPKINLRKGFTEIDNKYNTVSRNIEVIKPSSYPDVDKGNFIIAAHSGSSSVSFFKDLYKLELEDEILVTYNNKEYKYLIKNIYTNIKDGDVLIKRNKDITTLTLITCTKGDSKTQTIYITERVN